MKLQFQDAEFCVADKLLMGPVNLALDIHGITVVLGPNGAGKSLFLELAHGMITPTFGQVGWDGVSAQKSMRSRGYIFQNRTMLRRSIAQNIALPLQVAKWPKAQIKARVEELLDLSRLNDKANEPANILSGGEAQRMALVRALAHNPKAIIMDEPTSNLDPAASDAFDEIIKKVAQNGVSFLWATHNIAQAKQFADTVIFVADGRIQECSDASQFFNKPASEAGQNFLKGFR